MLTMIVSVASYAQDAFIDGIYYNLNSSAQKATVTNKEYGIMYSYEGDIKIPETITYGGVTYKVTSIDRDTFAYCDKMTSITIPESITSIGEAAFYNCSGLTSITLPKHIKCIDHRTFSGCSGLTSITIPESVNTIGNSAFASCYGLQSVVIPETTKNIYGFAFYQCISLTSIKLPNSITTIDQALFQECLSLSSITIPKNVTSIEEWAFQSCPSLTSIIVESGNTVYDSRNNCNAIIETASNKLIAGCKTTVIPNSVNSIGTEAFYGCTDLKSITIPASVKEISWEAFRECPNLKDLICLATTPPYMEYYNMAGCTLHVLPGYKTIYKADHVWGDFDIIEDATTGINDLKGCVKISQNKIFSLSGQQQDITTRGVNIINGMKFMRK